jgi:hypothetical protein
LTLLLFACHFQVRGLLNGQLSRHLACHGCHKIGS